MSSIYHFSDHMMFLSGESSPKAHKHLASHMILSLNGPRQWRLGQETVVCTGICIDANVEHVCFADRKDMESFAFTSTNAAFLVFLFLKTSNYAVSLDKTYLQGRDYAVLGGGEVERAIAMYETYKEEPEKADTAILHACGLHNKLERTYDSRVKEAISRMGQLTTLDNSVIADLSVQAGLSQSRFSHLFKEQTGMTLHSYLALEKIRKTYRYMTEGRNITQSCMLAGFDSPSHCSATCMRMFGVTMKDIRKSAFN